MTKVTMGIKILNSLKWNGLLGYVKNKLNQSELKLLWGVFCFQQIKPMVTVDSHPYEDPLNLLTPVRLCSLK